MSDLVAVFGIILISKDKELSACKQVSSCRIPFKFPFVFALLCNRGVCIKEVEIALKRKMSKVKL